MKNNSDEYKALIKVLNDASLSITERDDAAMDLYKYDCNEVIEALINFGSRITEHETILNSCGESLADIWIKKNKFDLLSYQKLSTMAKHGVRCSLRLNKKDWIDMYDL